jgi:hypothetical protein
MPASPLYGTGWMSIPAAVLPFAAAEHHMNIGGFHNGNMPAIYGTSRERRPRPNEDPPVPFAVKRPPPRSRGPHHVHTGQLFRLLGFWGVPFLLLFFLVRIPLEFFLEIFG